MERKCFSKIVSAVVLLLLAFTSCTSYKKVPYLQNSRELASATAELHEAKIMPQDLLTITVVCPEDPTAAMAYNLVAPADIANSGRNVLTSQPSLQNYIVGNDGTVRIPSIGVMKIAGLTLPEAEKAIYERVKKSILSDVVVTVRFVDFKVSVLGEVTSPGTYTVKNGKVNVFEALSMAKDMTIWGLRDNVKIVREDKDGNKNVYEVNLNDANIVNSPYYYLQQNDVVYVTPNESKAKNSDIGSSTSLWFSATSILVSLVSLLYNILK